jgi:hypothetical protein
MTSTPASQGVRLGRSSKSCATRLAVPTDRLSTSSTKVCGGPEGDTDAATASRLLQTSHQRPGATHPKATGQPSAQGQAAQLSAQSPALVNPVLLGSFVQPNPAYQRPAPASQSARIATDHVGRWVSGSGCPTCTTAPPLDQSSRLDQSHESLAPGGASENTWFWPRPV